MGNIIIKEVSTKKDKRNFIYLPSKVHQNNPNWLPPIYMDEWELFDEKKNKSFQYADTVLYLAYNDSEIVGRIMGVINRRYNEIHNESHGRFCFMECYEDQDVVHALISKVENWAKEKGMSKLVGPLAFSDKDPQGFQIEGFEYPKFIVCPTNELYLPEMLAREGYKKDRDLVNYLGKIPYELPSSFQKVLPRIIMNKEFRVIEFKSRRELKPYILGILELMNDTFKDIFGFVPLNDNEKQELVGRYIMILNPDFIKVVAAGDTLVGFAAGIPDISDGVRRARGKLLPFGFMKIFKEYRKSKKLLMLLGGVKEEYRGKGVDVLMADKMFKSCMKHKMEMIDLHLVLEDNLKMRGECERIGAQIIKRFRIYHKDI